MDFSKLWPKVVAALHTLPESGKDIDEFLLDTKLGQKRTNRIRICDDHLVRLSDGATSNPQIIRKKDILWYAERASTEGFCIKNQPGEPSRMGSIVCTILDLLDEFEYTKGQILYYRTRSSSLPIVES